MSGDEQLGLSRVLPVAHRFSNGTWIASAEVWGHGVVIRWARSELAQSSHVPVASLSLSDDLGTSYARRGGGASRNRRGSLGHAEFEPVPPPGATSLVIHDAEAEDLVSVSLTD